MAATKSSSDAVYPWHCLKADENEDGGAWIFRILIDSVEGRAYVKLTTDVERLEYMRQHHHDSYEIVPPSQTGWIDETAGLEYTIQIRSPEGEELAKLRSKFPDECWPPEGTKERREIEDYYRKHAHEIVDVETRAVLVPLAGQAAQDQDQPAA